MTARTRVRLELVPEPGPMSLAARVKRLLRVVKRQEGWRVVRVETIEPEVIGRANE